MATFNVNDFLHPLDRAARQQLEAVPLLQPLVRKYMSSVTDRQMRQWLLSSALRLGPRQLPEYYKLLPPICEAFGLREPTLYLMPGPANAFAIGHTQTAIVINSDLLENLAPNEVQAVLAHECGHILADHLLYRQMAAVLLELRRGAALLAGPAAALTSVASVPLRLALLNWYRRSELTADRAAVAFMGGPEPMQHALFRLIGLPAQWEAEEVSLEEFYRQSQEFEETTKGSTMDKVLALQLEAESTHPIPAIRIGELARWAQTDTYRQLQDLWAAANRVERPTCPACSTETRPEWAFCQRCGHDLKVGEPNR